MAAHSSKAHVVIGALLLAVTALAAGWEVSAAAQVAQMYASAGGGAVARYGMLLAPTAAGVVTVVVLLAVGAAMVWHVAKRGGAWIAYVPAALDAAVYLAARQYALYMLGQMMKLVR